MWNWQICCVEYIVVNNIFKGWERVNHIFTPGACGTNAVVIRGELRAERPEFLTVILPESLKKQPPESQALLSKVRF